MHKFALTKAFKDAYDKKYRIILVQFPYHLLHATYTLTQNIARTFYFYFRNYVSISKVFPFIIVHLRIHVIEIYSFGKEIFQNQLLNIS